MKELVRLIEVLDTIADAIDQSDGDLLGYEIARLCKEVKPDCFGRFNSDTDTQVERSCATCEVFDWCGVKG
jgi:hypothetical protein